MASDDGCTFEELCTRSKKSYACDNTVNIETDSFEDAKKKLIKHINDCIRKLGKRSRWIVSKFYIGKTYVRQNAEEVTLNPQDSSTYDKSGIASCWATLKHEDYGRDGMVVLTIVTQDAASRAERQHVEEYTLELQHTLIHHFKDIHDPRIANQYPCEGNREEEASPAYALFMSYSLADIRPCKPNEEDDGTRRKMASATTCTLTTDDDSAFKELCTGLKSYACDNMVDIGFLCFASAQQMIIKHIEGCIRSLEAGSHKRVTKFCIGKNSVDLIDPQDSTTYKKSGISSTWQTHKDMDGMVMLAIIIQAAVPQAKKPFYHEDYALELVRAIVDYFKKTGHDTRIAHENSSEQGKHDSGASVASGLYLTYNWGEPSDENSGEDKKQQGIEKLNLRESSS